MRSTYLAIAPLFFLLLLLSNGCKKPQSAEGEEPLARAYNDYLYPTDLKAFIGENPKPGDSALITNSLIRDWLAEKVILRQAFDNIEADEDIMKLVADYRASLIRAKYEERLLRKHLDTAITRDLMEEYYTTFNEQFPLAQPAVRYYLVRVPENHEDYRDVRNLMDLRKPEDLDEVVNLCSANNFLSSFDDNWEYFDKLAAKLPTDALTKNAVYQGVNETLNFKDQGFRYLLRILEVAKEGEPTPLDLIQGSLKKVILNRKKVETIENVKKQIYEKELNKQKVEIY